MHLSTTEHRIARTLASRIFCALLLVLATLGACSCHSASYYYYKFPAETFAGRPIPPSKLAQRVMIGVSNNGSSGSLQIVDASRDIRSNVENTIFSFSIAGYSSGYPGTILSYPEELRGFIYSNSDGSLTQVSYATESGSGSVGTFESGPNAVSVPPLAGHYYGAEEAANVLQINDNVSGQGYLLNLPNVFKVFSNKGDSVALALIRNADHNPNCSASNPIPSAACPASVYRIFKLSQNLYQTSQQAIAATGSADCQPTLLPIYCAVAVPGTYNEPINIYFSTDGSTAYVLNCAAECGAQSTTTPPTGMTASITQIDLGPLNLYNIPSSLLPPTNPQIANIPIPGGATAAISDGTTLYISGQQLQPDGRFAGFLTTVNEATNAITATRSISDGNHSKMLFADNNTLWIGSQFCATGERAFLGQNYNCLTMVDLSGNIAAPIASVQVLPNVTPNSAATTVPYPNQDNNQWYYGSLTGLCWVQNFNKVYTAYGGQVHIFSTVDGSEIDNQFVTVQGTALDVAYMDALTDDAN